MEDIVEVFVADACQKLGVRYLKEADAEMIEREWGYVVPVDKSSRRYDFVVETKDGDPSSAGSYRSKIFTAGGDQN